MRKRLPLFYSHFFILQCLATPLAQRQTSLVVLIVVIVTTTEIGHRSGEFRLGHQFINRVHAGSATSRSRSTPPGVPSPFPLLSSHSKIDVRNPRYVGDAPVPVLSPRRYSRHIWRSNDHPRCRSVSFLSASRRVSRRGDGRAERGLVDAERRVRLRRFVARRYAGRKRQHAAGRDGNRCGWRATGVAEAEAKARHVLFEIYSQAKLIFFDYFYVNCIGLLRFEDVEMDSECNISTSDFLSACKEILPFIGTYCIYK